MASVLSHAKIPRLTSNTVVISQNYADQAKSKWKFWQKDELEGVEKTEEQNEADSYQKYAQEIEKDARDEYIESRRNKSRLSYSHLQVVKGLPPALGTVFQTNTEHLSQPYKRKMLAKYGRKSGVNPGISWPSEEQMKLANDWERLYQPEPLSVMMEKAWEEVRGEKEKRIQREAEIDKNLETMEKQMKQWQDRVNSKNKIAEQAIHRRERILAELKQELGYDVNPADRHMVEKIAEKEKLLLKEEKEAKKFDKMEKEKLRKAKREAETQ